MDRREEQNGVTVYFRTLWFGKIPLYLQQNHRGIFGKPQKTVSGAGTGAVYHADPEGTGHAPSQEGDHEY